MFSLNVGLFWVFALFVFQEEQLKLVIRDTSGKIHGRKHCLGFAFCLLELPSLANKSLQRPKPFLKWKWGCLCGNCVGVTSRRHMIGSRWLTWIVEWVGLNFKNLDNKTVFLHLSMITRDRSCCVVSAALRRFQGDLQLLLLSLKAILLGMGQIYIWQMCFSSAKD